MDPGTKRRASDQGCWRIPGDPRRVLPTECPLTQAGKLSTLSEHA